MYNKNFNIPYVTLLGTNTVKSIVYDWSLHVIYLDSRFPLKTIINDSDEYKKSSF